MFKAHTAMDSAEQKNKINPYVLRQIPEKHFKIQSENFSV